MRRLAQGRVFDIQIIIYGPNHHLAGVHADSDLQSRFLGLAELSPVTPHFLLHRQSCVAGAQRVVFMRQRRTEKRHDAVTQHLIDGSFITMNRVHHDMKHRIDDLLGLLGIEAFHKAGGTSNVCEQNRHLLAFSFKGMPRG